MDVTWMLQCLRIVPNELAITPLPTPLITPPVTRMYFIAWQIKTAKEYLINNYTSGNYRQSTKISE